MAKQVTRGEIYNAIRAADAAGDTEAVKRLGAYVETIPLVHVEPEAPQPGPNPITDIGGSLIKGVPDVALSLVRGAVAQPVAGLLGAVAAPVVGADRAANVVRGVSSFIQGEPFSDIGKTAMGNIAKPISYAVENGAERPGEWVAEKTGSPALGAAVNTGIQGAAAFLLPGSAPIRSAFRSAGRAGVRAIRDVAYEPKPVGGVSNDVPPITVPKAVPTASIADPAVAKATAYAGSLGLDWDALAAPIREKLTRIAASAVDLNDLDGAAIAREAKLASLPVPVPATRGMLDRDPVALRNEGNVSATEAGAPIRDVHLAGNQALLDNLDVLKGRVSGTGSTAATATTAEEAGGVVQGAARAKEAASTAGYRALFKTARETEPDARAPLDPVADLLKTNPEVQHLGWVDAWLKKAGRTNLDAEGNAQIQTDATLAELADLRSQATAIAGTGGKEGYYAGQVVGAVDNAMQAVPQGASAWRTALDAFKAHKHEFSDQAAVADLVENASRTDRATALESTVRTITNGSLEDIRKVKTTLLTGDDAATRTAGRKAWREVRAQIVQAIKDEATKGVATNVDGTPNLTPAALKRAIDRYGPEKLDELLGPGSAKHVYKILDAAVDVKTVPPSRVAGSSTVANVLAFLEKGLGKIPLVGDTTVGAIKGVAKLRELGAESRTVTKATETTPLKEAVKTATKQARKDAGAQEAKKLTRAAPTALTVSEIAAQAAQGKRR